MKNKSGDNPRDDRGASIRQKITSSLEEGRRFFREELWDMDLRPLPRMMTAVISFLRIVSIVIRGFIADKCSMQAGTLTYLTLMALVPILALMFSISQGMGIQERLMESLGLQLSQVIAENGADPGNTLPFEHQFEIIEDSRLAEMPEQFGNVAITVFSVVERTNVRTLGVIGLLFLIWTVIRVMGRVEKSFNSIWGVHKSRSFTQRVSGYISILVVVPILILSATSVNAFLSSEKALELVQNYFGGFLMVYEFAIRGAMLGVVILAFVFLLMFMPNTRVHFMPALIGGIVTALAWLALQAIYFMAQSGVTMYNAIYGTFAALPFFLVWLHTSWLIVLFGAEITFAVQNHRTYRMEQRADQATPATLTALGIIIMFQIVRLYVKGDKPWTVDSFIDRHHISVRLVGDVLRTLRDHGLACELAEQPDGYLPGRDPSHITLDDIEFAFRGKPKPQIVKLLAESAPALEQWNREFRRKTGTALAGKTLRNLVDSRPESGQKVRVQ